MKIESRRGVDRAASNRGRKSGNTYSGNYYLAPVSFTLADGTVVSTAPILVLGITSASCAPGHPKCNDHPPKPDLHYLGVGFDRGATSSADSFTSPVDNAFLQVAGATDGAMTPGYVLSTSGVTLGITSTEGYSLDALTPSSIVSGDWVTAAGCYGFPDLAGVGPFCGTLLLDVGIVEMFIDLQPAERPQDAVEPAACTDPTEVGKLTCKVPGGTTMQIVAGSPSAPALSYEFAVSDTPSGPAPTYVQWINAANVFVNIGRRPLTTYDYMFDAHCGNVGFKQVN